VWVGHSCPTPLTFLSAKANATSTATEESVRPHGPKNTISPSVQKCSLLSWGDCRQITGRIQRTSPTGSGVLHLGPKYSMAEMRKPQLPGTIGF
jgi:hypothetical protein